MNNNYKAHLSVENSKWNGETAILLQEIKHNSLLFFWDYETISRILMRLHSSKIKVYPQKSLLKEIIVCTKYFILIIYLLYIKISG